MTQLVEIHGDGPDDLRAIVDIVSVHVDLAQHRPMPLPEWIGPMFAEFDATAAGGALATGLTHG
jgi:acyl-CoA thioesterase FadM